MNQDNVCWLACFLAVASSGADVEAKSRTGLARGCWKDRGLAFCEQPYQALEITGDQNVHRWTEGFFAALYVCLDAVGRKTAGSFGAVDGLLLIATCFPETI